MKFLINKIPSILLLAVIVLSLVSFLSAREQPGVKQLQKPEAITGTPTRSILSICNWTYWINYDGESAHSPARDLGGIYPKGTVGAIYKDGLIIGVGHTADGDTVNPRIGGQTYRIGTIPGYINAAGDPVGADDPGVRIYRIRRDWRQIINKPSMVLNEARILYQHDSPAQVTDAELVSVVSQYETDWNEWPIHLGAPYYDKDNSGSWTVGDEPGIASADQVIWLVINDFDEGATNAFHGCPPIGLEIQITLWGYNYESETVGQMLFKRFKVINKSGVDLTDVYLAQWGDLDIGDYGDDFVGCDTLLELGFGYNGVAHDNVYDMYGLTPSAVGYSLLQGPLVASPGDTAIFDFKKVLDYKNIPMTSFGYCISDSSIPDPALGVYSGALQWYNLLRGYTATDDLNNPIPWHEGNNPGNPVTRFPLAGDPATGVGDIDGVYDVNRPPGDRRMFVSTGPFDMIPGESQEIVLAVVGGMGSTNLNSVQVLKQNVQAIQNIYGESMIFPDFSYVVEHSNDSQTQLIVQVDFKESSGVTSGEVDLSPEYGSEPDITLTLYDDGMHNDSLSGDNIWGNSIIVLNRKYPYKADLILQTSGGQKDFSDIESDIRLRPLPDFINWRVIWEDGKQDGCLNNGEKVHLNFDIVNNDFINNIDTIIVGGLNFNTSISSGDTLLNDSLYMVSYADWEGEFSSVRYSLEFDNYWKYCVEYLPLIQWDPPMFWRDVLEVTSSIGIIENLKPIVVDPAFITGHQYAVTFIEDTQMDQTFWQLSDLTTATVLFDSAVIVELYDRDFPHPFIDGIMWKVINPPVDIKNWSYESGTVSSLYPEYNSGLWLSGVGYLGLNVHENFAGNSTVADEDLVPVEIHFTPMITFTDTSGDGEYQPGEPYTFDTNMGSLSYFYEQREADTFLGVAYLPIQAFDVSDPANPRQLNIAISDSNANLLWELETDDTPIECIYILATDYDETGTIYDPTAGGTDLMASYDDPGLPGYYSHSGYPRGLRPFLAEGGILKIIPFSKNKVGDTLFVNTAAQYHEYNLPDEFGLFQNYPNPFNAVTNIKFEIKERAKVRIDIFNILGQKVKTLVNTEMDRDTYTFPWYGRNDNGYRVGSGIYFYCLKAGDYFKSKKMILLK